MIPSLRNGENTRTMGTVKNGNKIYPKDIPKRKIEFRREAIRTWSLPMGHALESSKRLFE